MTTFDYISLAAGALCALVVTTFAALTVILLSGKRVEPFVHDETPFEDEPTAEYVPCGHTWPNSKTLCGDGGIWHSCDMLPGGHRRHHCTCGEHDEPRPLLVVDEDTQEPHVDEPVTRIYTEPGWTHFRGGLVHVDCVAKALDDIPPCAGCAVHLDHVLTGAA